jgi:two-component system chemotaxis response regulator CheY
MKGMSGLDVLKKLTEMDGQARVIVVSADVQDSSRVLAESGGAAGFLNKPVDRAALLGAVSKTLETGTSWS